MKKILFILFLLPGLITKAQDSTGSLAITGYVETYYTYDFNKPAGHDRSGFIYSHNRHNEFNLNLGFIKAAYTAQRVRANLALGAGTYMNANYAAEPGVLKNLVEANAGIRISKKKNLWIDAGIMPSHIGFESAVSKDCWNLTRSILADNSPYFEAGAKLTYTTDDGKWLLSAMALNGWQRITSVPGNSRISWGTQVQYKPSGKVLLNYSTFTGTDKPDSARLSRLFHNIYGVFNITDRWGITAGFDIGTEEKLPGSDQKNTWYAPVLILRHAFNTKWALAARAEYYHDKNGVIVAVASPNGFRVSGYSLNLDHSPAKNVLVRMEIRRLQSPDAIFTKPGGTTRNNTFFTTSAAVSF